MSAVKGIELANLRRMRAQSFAAALMDELKDILPPETEMSDVYYRLLEVLEKNGACWTTDEERAAHDFEPRDELGWTPTERVAQKKRELEAMQMAAAGIVVPRTTCDS